MIERPKPVEVQVPQDIRKLWDERGDPVVKIPAECLRQVAKPVERPTRATRELVDRMKAAMLQANGIGLAAPQLGVLERVIVVRLAEENAPLHVFLNPKIVSAKGEQIGGEGCLSLPMLHGDVKRAREIVVKGMDMLGRPIRRRAVDMEARVFQHEIDHLDGILFVDRADLDTLEWCVPGQEEPEDTIG